MLRLQGRFVAGRANINLARFLRPASARPFTTTPIPDPKPQPVPWKDQHKDEGNGWLQGSNGSSFLIFYASWLVGLGVFLYTRESEPEKEPEPEPAPTESPKEETPLPWWRRGLGKKETPTKETSAPTKETPQVPPPKKEAPQSTPDEKAIKAQKHFELGKRYFEGKEMFFPRDDQRAAEELQLAANLGHGGAQSLLGYFYKHGLGGLAADPKKAAELYQRAANQGVAQAQANLGIMYQLGEGGLRKDYRRSLRLYQQSAEQGYPQGQINLGLAYREGVGVSVDYKRAAYYFELASPRSADAKVLFASMLEIGQGVPEDKRRAIDLYMEAAKQQNSFAYENLGRLYETGCEEHLKQDKKLATKYTKLAKETQSG